MPLTLLLTALGALFTLGLTQGTRPLPPPLPPLPAIALLAAVSFAVQWVAFIPAYRRQTERYYDLTGSLTYIACTLLALGAAWGDGAGGGAARGWLLGACVLVWAARLGSFLFRRVRQDGGDGRFDHIKPRAGAFLTAWTTQGLWALVTASAAWAGILSARPAPLGWGDAPALALWAAGFAVEVTADRQKRAWRAARGPGSFVREGLWRYSRHPNYLGEITLWAGVALLALPALSGWLYLSLLSPVGVYLLLTRVSGVPLLEARARARWGDDPDYQDYLRRTPRLAPWGRP